MIGLIAAVSSNGVIGQENKLPFDYKEDMMFFRTMTANSAVIMGRKTWESIRRPLPKRRNIVISRTQIDVDNVETFEDVEAAVVSSVESHKNVWFIGGSSIYREGMTFASDLYITLTPDYIVGEGLIFLPWIDPSKFEVKEYLPLPGSKLQVAHYVRYGANGDI